MSKKSNKTQIIKVPADKLKEMLAISDLMRNLQYQFNLCSKDLTIFQFQTLKGISEELGEAVQKGFKVYEVDMNKGVYVITPSKNVASKEAEVDEAINKNGNLPN